MFVKELSVLVLYFPIKQNIQNIYIKWISNWSVSVTFHSGTFFFFLFTYSIGNNNSLLCGSRKLQLGKICSH